ncbi:MAG TPA: nucleotidyltransferase domain-containing protein [Bacillaceae bacterium]|nr:nucleotidyltransferase domain-containing protein [Paenibacillus bovis]HLU23869.1 nucleotidyltransferase domain-containing protein [Bacillaceae bacterium]
MDDKELRKSILQQLNHILTEALVDYNVRIYLFGSWARNEEKQSSDIDIAIESLEEIPVESWIKLIDKVEESTIPYNVDVVNLKEASSSLIQNVHKEGILWKDFKNG